MALGGTNIDVSRPVGISYLPSMYKASLMKTRWCIRDINLDEMIPYHNKLVHILYTINKYSNIHRNMITLCFLKHS